LIILCALAISVPVFINSRPGREKSAPAAFSVASTSRNYVRISGALKQPGVYLVSVNTMADAAIKMANPVSSKMQRYIGIDPNDLVTNGMALHLAVQPDGVLLVTKSQMTASERLVMGIPLDINVMSAADFDRVPGIGPALARRIVKYRQDNGGIMAVSDLLSIEGIGELKFKQLAIFF
jgi:competence protein ComEA